MCVWGGGGQPFRLIPLRQWLINPINPTVYHLMEDERTYSDTEKINVDTRTFAIKPMDS